MIAVSAEGSSGHGKPAGTPLATAAPVAYPAKPTDPVAAGADVEHALPSSSASPLRIARITQLPPDLSMVSPSRTTTKKKKKRARALPANARERENARVASARPEADRPRCRGVSGSSRVEPFQRPCDSPTDPPPTPQVAHGGSGWRALGELCFAFVGEAFS